MKSILKKGSLSGEGKDFAGLRAGKRNGDVHIKPEKGKRFWGVCHGGKREIGLEASPGRGSRRKGGGKNKI